jgi:hypothetical protein
MPETWLVKFTNLNLCCEVFSGHPLKLAQFYFADGNDRAPVCDLRQVGAAPVTFSLWSTGGQIVDWERLQKALNLAAELMKSWNAKDGKTFKGVFPGEQYELSKL